MKIKLTMQETFLEVDVQEDRAMSVFRRLAEKLFLYAGEKEPEEKPEETNLGKLMQQLKATRREAQQQEPEKQDVKRQQEPNTDPEENQTKPEKIKAKPSKRKDYEGYKGFLLIRCKDCGQERAYCSKIPTTAYRCHECGAATELEGLRSLWMYCQCGNKSHYNTNIEDAMAEVNCIVCGAPVTTEWNKKKKMYQTVGGMYV